MTIWQNDQLTKWPVDKMTSRQNDQLTKRPVTKMTRWQNDQLTKWPVEKMTERHFFICWKNPISISEKETSYLLFFTWLTLNPGTILQNFFFILVYYFKAWSDALQSGATMPMTGINRLKIFHPVQTLQLILT